MGDAHSRRFDVIAVWKFDRFARSVSHLLRALEAFQALGIEFVSLSEQGDTSTPTGKMVFAYSQGEGSLSGLAARFGTSVGTVQRCIRMHQSPRNSAAS